MRPGSRVPAQRIGGNDFHQIISHSFREEKDSNCNNSPFGSRRRALIDRRKKLRKSIRSTRGIFSGRLR